MSNLAAMMATFFDPKNFLTIWKPNRRKVKYGGTTLTPADEPRLDTQLYFVYHIMKDGVWRTIPELEALLLSEYGVVMQTSISARIRDFRKTKFGGHIVNAKNAGRGLWKYQLVLKGKTTIMNVQSKNVFDLGERIKQVRAIEAFIEKKQEELDAALAKHHEFVEIGRAEILGFLNQTNQKSANTEFGGCHWKPKITYRVEDKDTFRRHVIGSEAWELITWASAPVNCEAFTEEHNMPPPGLVRNAVNILYITPPTKPKAKNKVVKE